MKINKKGFTLIELLVVIAIIGILAGIVLVSLNTVRERATISSMRSTMASVTTIANMCINEGGTIDAGTDPGDLICTGVADITDVHPTLPANMTDYTGYTYAAAGGTDGGPAFVSAGGALATITCTVNTGSCL